MAGVKTVALLDQFARPLAKSVENAIGYVEQPGAEGEKQRWDKRQAEMHGAGEEPRPKGSNRWRIQAEQMPPFGKIVAATGQDPVYFAAACQAATSQRSLGAPYLTTHFVGRCGIPLRCPRQASSILVTEN